MDIQIAPSGLKEVLLKNVIPSGLSAMITGAPGIGKSDIIREVGRETGREVREFRASMMDPIDSRGLPSIEGGKTTWNIPDTFPRDGEGIIFLDEINTASKMMQASLYQLVLDGKLGDYVVPPGWIVIAAGNRKVDRAIVNDAGTALATRFVHLELGVDLDDFTAYAAREDSDIATEVLAFTRFRPELLHKWSADEKTHPTPRTWAFVSRLLATKPSRKLALPLYAGCVGEAAAIEFVGFLDIMDRITPIDQILMDPDGAPVPEDRDVAVLYAQCAALAKATTKDNVAKVLTYIDRLPAEFQAFAVKAAILGTESVKRTKAFAAWAVKNADVQL